MIDDFSILISLFFPVGFCWFEWVFVEISGKNLAGITKGNYARISGGIPAGIFGGIPDENPGDISARISNRIHGIIIAGMPGRVPEKNTWRNACKNVNFCQHCKILEWMKRITSEVTARHCPVRMFRNFQKETFTGILK